MNKIISQIADATVINVWKTYDLLDHVLEAEAINFPTNEIKYDDAHDAFVSQVDKYQIIVMRDLNRSIVVSRVVLNDTTIAECVVAIDGQYTETYGRISDVALKQKISNWFTAIGSIDITTLTSTGTARESSSPAVSDVVDVAEEIPDTTEDAESISD